MHPFLNQLINSRLDGNIQVNAVMFYVIFFVKP